MTRASRSTKLPPGHSFASGVWGCFFAMAGIAAGCDHPMTYVLVPYYPPNDTGGAGGIGGTGGIGGAGGAGGAGGVPLDPVRVCIDHFEWRAILCSSPLEDYPEAFCLNKVADLGPECADEFAATYACWTATALATKMCPVNTPECNMLDKATNNCTPKPCDDDSFVSKPICRVWDTSQTKCGCDKVCGHSKFTLQCTQDSTIRNCDCLIDDALVGTCEEPAGPYCEARYGCCNQYFNLPQWPK